MMWRFLLPIFALAMLMACTSGGAESNARETLRIHVAGFVKAEGMT